jgi:hypothetical protein
MMTTEMASAIAMMLVPTKLGSWRTRAVLCPPANTPECIWFVDGWTPPIKQVRFVRVGRQVFAMVNEPDENIDTDTPDVVFAWVTVPHTGDLEIFRLTEIGGTSTGIFAGLGPLLVQASFNTCGAERWEPERLGWATRCSCSTATSIISRSSAWRRRGRGWEIRSIWESEPDARSRPSGTERHGIGL